MVRRAKPFSSENPNPVDVHVGARLRLRRTMLGMSQTKLADAVGLTFQQIQKYERGTNRVGSSRLFEFARVLGVPVSYFYEDQASTLGAPPPSRGQREHDAIDSSQLAKRETLELVRAYYKIADPTVRRRLFEMTKALARATAKTDA